MIVKHKHKGRQAVSAEMRNLLKKVFFNLLLGLVHMREKKCIFFLNVHFLRKNMHFFKKNIHFFKCMFFFSRVDEALL